MNDASFDRGRTPKPSDKSTESADKDGLRTWLRLLACTGQIERRVRDGFRQEFAFTLPRFDVLAQLDRNPNGMSMGGLSEQLMVSAGNITGLIERLRKDGLVDRVADPQDRRTQWVKLTPAGKALFARLAPRHRAWIRAMFADMAAEQVEELLGLLSTLKRSLDANR